MWLEALVHRSLACSILFNSNYHTSGYNKNFTTTYLLAKEHMSMFVVKSIVIQMKGQRRDSSILIIVRSHGYNVIFI
jgi:hypothetical protein